MFSRRLARLTMDSLCMEAEYLGALVRDTLDEKVTHVIIYREKGQRLERQSVQMRYVRILVV